MVLVEVRPHALQQVKEIEPRYRSLAAARRVARFAAVCPIVCPVVVPVGLAVVIVVIVGEDVGVPPFEVGVSPGGGGAGVEDDKPRREKKASTNSFRCRWSNQRRRSSAVVRG